MTAGGWVAAFLAACAVSLALAAIWTSVAEQSQKFLETGGVLIVVAIAVALITAPPERR